MNAKRTNKDENLVTREQQLITAVYIQCTNTKTSYPPGTWKLRCVHAKHKFSIGHVLNERGTGYEHIFSWYEHSVSIELKMGHVI